MSIADAQPTCHMPQVAGMFYPDTREDCAALVVKCLASARPSPVADPKIIIAPHAGYVYSGPVAATVYAPLKKRANVIRRVVLVGPAHRVAFEGLATIGADAWRTPLGDIPVDRNAIGRLSASPDFGVNDRAFGREHSLEVHLPFLQTVLGDFELIPILVGDASPDTVAEALETVWGGPETLIVISSDLSHFHDYETARCLDRETARNIESLNGDLNGKDACGCRGISGALIQARKRDLRVTGLDIRNSGDTAGDKSRVVGYGAFAMEEAETARLTDADRETLLRAAYSTLQAAIKIGRMPEINIEGRLSPSLTAMRATFVTLKIDGDLRGCVGSLVPQRPLIADVMSSAYKAGFSDRRFNALGQAELERLSIDVSILSHPRPVAVASEDELIAKLRTGKDGLILGDGSARALFLPSVWESLPNPRDFVGRLKQKAGLPPDHWSATMEAKLFTTESFGAKAALANAARIEQEAERKPA